MGFIYRLFGKPVVSVQQARRMLDEGAIILDVREKSEFDLGHIPHSRLMPLSTMADHLQHVPRGKKLIVACRTGGRSTSAVARLQAEGIHAVNLEGGLIAWRKAGFDLVDVNGAPGNIS